MIGSRFVRYALRTKDTKAGEAFYSAVFGPEFWGADVAVVPLPERAAALGAPAHWLGHISVADVDAAVARIVELGGQPLGPTQRTSNGTPFAPLRDPFGAVMAVTAERVIPRELVRWHLLHTRDCDRALELYASLFGWVGTESADRAAEDLRTFAWKGSEKNVGAVSNMARSPQIHTHWLFYFNVADIEHALERVRANGGTVMAPTRMANGDQVAMCEDSQRAAFGICQTAGWSLGSTN